MKKQFLIQIQTKGLIARFGVTCKELGHFRRNCPMLNADEKKKVDYIVNSVTSGEGDKSLLAFTPREAL